MIIKTKDGKRIMIALGHLQAIYPDRNEYCIQVAGQRFVVNGETGELILDDEEKREADAQREDEMDMERKTMVLAAIKRAATPHPHDEQGNCLSPPPKPDPGAWLADLDLDDVKGRPVPGEGN